MSGGHFLIDANVMIEPCNQYYAFDLVPEYWNRLAPFFEDGTIILLDLVKKEIHNEELVDWFDHRKSLTICNHRDAQTIGRYRDVMNHIQSCGYYKQPAIDVWARATVADPWLVAAAAVYGHQIVTAETPASGLNPRNKQGKVKLPNVADEFNVEWCGIFDMMRELGIRI